MKAKHWRIRFVGETGHLYGVVNSVNIYDKYDVNLTQTATKSYVTANTGHGNSYDLANLVAPTPSRVWIYNYNHPTGPYTGLWECIILSFAAATDVRKCVINWASTQSVVIECSMDQNIWFCVGRSNDESGSTAVQTFNIPSVYKLPKLKFWGLKIKTHTPSNTSDVKIKNLIMKNEFAEAIPDFQTRWNMFYNEPRQWDTATMRFSEDGTVNQIADPLNTIGVAIAQSNMQRGAYNAGIGGTDSWWGEQASRYYNHMGARPMPFWNGSGSITLTQGRYSTYLDVNFTAAQAANDPVPANYFDQFFALFDNANANKPVAVSLGGTSSVRPGDRYGASYQPYDMDDYVLIDNFSQFMTDGITIAGLKTGALTINGDIFVPDVIPPVTSIDPPQGSYITVQTISFTRDEPGTTYYTINGGAEQTYTVPFDISENSLIAFHSVDTVGNIEAVQYSSYVVDLIPPTTTIDPSPGLYNTELNVSFNISEDSTTYYKFNYGPEQVYQYPIHINANAHFEFYSIDTLGNREATQTADFLIDLIIPTSTITPDPQLYTLPIVIRMQSNDPTAEIHYTINGGIEEIYTDPIPMQTDVEISWWAIDPAGNIEPTNTVQYTFDIQLVIPDPLPGYFLTPQTITLSATQPGIIKFEIV